MGEKPNALRAEAGNAPELNQGKRLKISGLTGDRIDARVQQISNGKRAQGNDFADFIAAMPDGSRHTVSVEPWYAAVPQCAPAECALLVERIDHPDGPEMRLTVSRKGAVVALVAVSGRLRRLPGGVALQPKSSAIQAPPSGRVGVDLRVGGQVVERGKSAEVILDNRRCRLHLYDASVAAAGRPGIAEESAAFTADWVLVCK